MSLTKRLDEIGWALFLIMIGLFWLVPVDVVPEGAWLLGAGLILVGINSVRYAKAIGINGFTTTLGVFALIAGALSVAGVPVPLFPILLVVVGAMMLLKPFFRSPGVMHHNTPVTH